jgi:hypothetical protein
MIRVTHMSINTKYGQVNIQDRLIVSKKFFHLIYQKKNMKLSEAFYMATKFKIYKSLKLHWISQTRETLK